MNEQHAQVEDVFHVDTVILCTLLFMLALPNCDLLAFNLIYGWRFLASQTFWLGEALQSISQTH